MPLDYRKIMSRTVDLFMYAMIGAGILILLLGCAMTTIEIPLPDGRRAYYSSTRDSDISGLHIEMLADGTVKIDLEGASGQASPVVQAYGEVMAAGIKSLVEGAAAGASPFP
jgi:hypothetical protein